jgi:pyrimidine operon attenuation protein/uracil phosphoribosyltransferase
MNFNGNLKDLKGKQVVLVDDVLNSGRTLMYASRYLLDAEVKQLSIATLIDRFHRRFPMRANFVGLTLSTNLKEHVTVDFTSKKESVHLEA